MPFSVDFVLFEPENETTGDDGQVEAFTLFDGNQSASGVAAVALDEAADTCRIRAHVVE